MTRILFIFAKLHPKVQYVQGMNELIAPIFYLLQRGGGKEGVQEAACFFMFNNVMADIIELHVRSKGEDGIYGRMNNISGMLLVSIYLYRHWNHLFGIG